MLLAHSQAHEATEIARNCAQGFTLIAYAICLSCERARNWQTACLTLADRQKQRVV